jgi:VanZ family protein
VKNFIKYQLPLFIWAVIIFWLSSIKTFPNLKLPFIGVDKLVHMSVFFVFCWFSRRALFFQIASSTLKRWSLIGAFLLTCLYGYFDEVHQLYVPTRSYDYFDMLADGVGALLFVALFMVTNRWRTGEKQTS